MSCSRNLKKIHKSADFAFFIYFTAMALFFTKTYIQLAAQLGIIAYVAYKQVVTKKRMGKNTMRNLGFLLVWFGMFTVFAKLSEYWAYDVKSGSNTVLTLFRMLAIGIALFVYATDFETVVAVIKSFVYSNVIMAVAVLALTPLSQYGKAGDDGFGNVIGQQRNTFGGIMAFLVLLCIVLYQYDYFKYGRHLAAFFTVALFCSGSRGAMLQLLIIACFYVVTIPGAVKKLKYFVAAILVGIAVVFLLKNVPYLYEVVWVRFEGLINTVLGFEENADSSTYGRELYKVLAAKMFKERPLKGYGVDGFYCVLRDVEYVNGYYLPPRYSHCNFTEIASCFGIIGLAIWYLPVFSVWWGSFKMKKAYPYMNTVFIILTSMIVLDYARIPWMTHISTYTYFLIILFYKTLKQKIDAEKDIHRAEFGALKRMDF